MASPPKQQTAQVKERPIRKNEEKTSHQKEPQEKTIFHVWADGSYREKNQSMGGGIVVHRTHTEEFIAGRDPQILIKALHLGHNNSGSSLIAELETCVAALKTIPNDAVVILHNDCQNVFDAIRRGTKKHKKPMLEKSFNNLFNQVARMKDVKAIWAYERDDDNIKICHNLAQLGTYTNNQEATLSGAAIQFENASKRPRRRKRRKHRSINKRSTPAL